MVRLNGLLAQEQSWLHDTIRELYETRVRSARRQAWMGHLAPGILSNGFALRGLAEPLKKSQKLFEAYANISGGGAAFVQTYLRGDDQRAEGQISLIQQLLGSAQKTEQANQAFLAQVQQALAAMQATKAQTGG
jgi:hypothetical protein